MTEKTDLKKFIKKNPIGFVYMATGILMLILGILIMDGYLAPTKELTTAAVFGYFMTLNAGIVMVVSSIKLAVDKHDDEIKKIKRDNRLQDLQQEKES